MRASLLFLFASLLFLPACSYAPVAKVYPLTDLEGRLPTDYIEVYTHPNSLTRPHREIAIIKAVASERVHQPEREDAEYLDVLKQKAQEIGADAIVIIEEQAPFLFGNDERERAARIARKGRLPNAPRSTRTVLAKAVVYTSR